MHGPMGGPRRMMEQETSKPKQTGATLARLAQYFRPYTLALIVVAILIVASTWTQVTAPQLIGQSVDCYLMPAAAERLTAGAPASMSFLQGGGSVTRADNRQPVPVGQDDEEFTFRTTAGVTYEIARAECAPLPAGAPVIETHPRDAAVVLHETATFMVSATDKDLSYQWQKNRADIPGATSLSYTTPATTLWDIGSVYRCVVSNAFGATRSRPGILNIENVYTGKRTSK